MSERDPKRISILGNAKPPRVTDPAAPGYNPNALPAEPPLEPQPMFVPPAGEPVAVPNLFPNVALPDAGLTEVPPPDGNLPGVALPDVGAPEDR